MITNKVYSPQYALWILPLIALARPAWRAWLIWQATEIILLILLYAHLIFVDTNGNVLPRDGISSGRLQTRGPGVVRRYFKQDEDCVDSDQWFDTGDMAAIHPRQVAAINRVYTPSEEEGGRAREVVTAAASAEAGGSGALRLPSGDAQASEPSRRR